MASQRMQFNARARIALQGPRSGYAFETAIESPRICAQPPINRACHAAEREPGIVLESFLDEGTESHLKMDRTRRQKLGPESAIMADSCLSADLSRRLLVLYRVTQACRPRNRGATYSVSGS
jgi:hypothetical protein